MRHFRAEGLPFMIAWTRTLHALPRGGYFDATERCAPHEVTQCAACAQIPFLVASERKRWTEALVWSRPAWQASYEGRSLGEVLAEENAARQRAAQSPRSRRVTAAERGLELVA